jgi:uncharacterized membrane protein YgcG
MTSNLNNSRALIRRTARAALFAAAGVCLAVAYPSTRSATAAATAQQPEQQQEVPQPVPQQEEPVVVEQPAPVIILEGQPQEAPQPQPEQGAPGAAPGQAVTPTPPPNGTPPGGPQFRPGSTPGPTVPQGRPYGSDPRSGYDPRSNNNNNNNNNNNSNNSRDYRSNRSSRDSSGRGASSGGRSSGGSGSSAAAVLPPDFSVLSSRSIFVKGGRLPEPGGNRVFVDPRPTPPAPSAPPLVFDGVLKDESSDNRVMAVLEDASIAPSKITIAKVGDTVPGGGKVTKIALDKMEITQADGRVVTILIGQNLQGASASVGYASGATTSSSGGTGSSADSGATSKPAFAAPAGSPRQPGESIADYLKRKRAEGR